MTSISFLPRLVESPSTIFCAWENLMKETEVDAQVRDTYEPLHVITSNVAF